MAESALFSGEQAPWWLVHLDEVPMAMAVIKRGHVTWHNRMVAEYAGHVVGRRAAEVWPAPLTGVIEGYAAPWRTLDGTVRIISTSCQKLGDGGSDGLLAVGLDITDSVVRAAEDCLRDLVSGGPAGPITIDGRESEFITALLAHAGSAELRRDFRLTVEELSGALARIKMMAMLRRGAGDGVNRRP